MFARGTWTTSYGGSRSAHARRCVAQRRRHHLVGIEDEDPVAARLADREASRRVGDAAGALVLEDRRAHALGDRRGLVLAVLVHDDDLVAPGQQRAEGVVELMRLVERDDDTRDARHGSRTLDLAARTPHRRRSERACQQVPLARVDGRQVGVVLEAEHRLLHALVLGRPVVRGQLVPLLGLDEEPVEDADRRGRDAGRRRRAMPGP